jgi:hypothetical protein
MLLLSAKARRLIDAAVNDLPDPEQRGAWLAWAQANPNVRTPEGPADDGGGPIPTGIAAVALAALARKAARLQGRLVGPVLDDGETSDIENDLTFIDSVEAVLIRNLREASAQKAA